MTELIYFENALILILSDLFFDFKISLQCVSKKLSSQFKLKIIEKFKKDISFEKEYFQISIDFNDNGVEKIPNFFKYISKEQLFESLEFNLNNCETFPKFYDIQG